MPEESIVALATPPGRGGIAVIRISGADSEAILRRLVAPLPRQLMPRRCFRAYLQDAGRRLDECLVLFFRAPHSYSGEDTVEISLHGNEFLAAEALKLACGHGARPALPGEFTYRAFRNGKLDLLQAEAVNELVQARSLAGARLEFGVLEGGLSRAVAGLRADLLREAAALESGIEFAEDQQLDEPAAAGGLDAAAAGLERLLARGRFAEPLTRGLRVVIAGRVNVGKSSLFNALLLQERAIVSATPGTTRDTIEETLHLEGFSLRLTDMAGIQEATGDALEAQGIRRSLEQIEAADAALLVVDASCPPQPKDVEIARLLGNKPRLLLANKCDRADAAAVAAIFAAFAPESPQLVSAACGENLSAVWEFLKRLPQRLGMDAADLALSVRQRQLLEELRQTIRRAANLRRQAPAVPELAAEELRRGLRLVGELTGAIGADDVLRQIFASFCIGK